MSFCAAGERERFSTCGWRIRKLSMISVDQGESRLGPGSEVRSEKTLGFLQLTAAQLLNPVHGDTNSSIVSDS